MLRNVTPGIRPEPPSLPREIWADGALTVSKCAQFMDCSRKTVFEKMNNGLPWGRFGEQRRIPKRAAIDDLAGCSGGED